MQLCQNTQTIFFCYHTLFSLANILPNFLCTINGNKYLLLCIYTIFLLQFEDVWSVFVDGHYIVIYSYYDIVIFNYKDYLLQDNLIYTKRFFE